MSTITQTLLKKKDLTIVNLRIRNNLKRDPSEKKGSVDEKRKTNAIFIFSQSVICGTLAP